jgi:hypothetical protein
MVFFTFYLNACQHELRFATQCLSKADVKYIVKVSQQLQFSMKTVSYCPCRSN